MRTDFSRTHADNMQAVRKHKELLRVLCEANPRQRKALLAKASPAQINLFSELALNLLGSKVPISPCQYKKLKKFKKHLRILGCRKSSLRKRKKIVNQVGGALLPLLIKPVLALLGSVLGTAL